MDIQKKITETSIAIQISETPHKMFFKCDAVEVINPEIVDELTEEEKAQIMETMRLNTKMFNDFTSDPERLEEFIQMLQSDFAKKINNEQVEKGAFKRYIEKYSL